MPGAATQAGRHFHTAQDTPTSQVHPGEPPGTHLSPETPLETPQDSLEAPLSPHLLGAVVGVAAGTVPVARHGFWVQSGHNPKVLTDTVEDEPSHPQVIPHLDALTRAHLEFPLQGASRQQVKDGQGRWVPSPATSPPLPARAVARCYPWESAIRMGSIDSSNGTALALKKKKKRE